MIESDHLDVPAVLERMDGDQIEYLAKGVGNYRVILTFADGRRYACTYGQGPFDGVAAVDLVSRSVTPREAMLRLGTPPHAWRLLVPNEQL